MPAGLTTTDGMFTVREAAWHGLGVVFEDYPTREQAQKIAHPWEPIKVPLFHQVPKRDEDGNELIQLPKSKAIAAELRGKIVTVDEAPKDDDGKPIGKRLTQMEEVSGWYENRRSDTGLTLGVVSDKYVAVKNDEMWDIAEALEQSGKDVMFETGGSLDGGAKVWVMVRLAEPLTIKGDPRGETIPYFALQNSHDGTTSFRGQAIMTRIVCMNTAQAADYEAKARGTEFMFKHTKNVRDRIGQAREALSGWRDAVTEWQEMQEHLITLKVTDAGVEEFLERFIPKPISFVSDRVLNNIDAEREKWLMGYNSITGEGIEGTAYGLIQASTEYANHYRKAHNAESRFKRTFLSRDRLIADAVQLAQDAAKVEATATSILMSSAAEPTLADAGLAEVGTGVTTA